MAKETSYHKLYLLLGMGITVISFAGILIKISSAPPLIISFYRMAISSLLLSPLFFLKYRDKVNYFFNPRLILVGFLLSIHFFLWVSAFEYTNVANAVIFIALQPLFTLILEFFFAREDLQEGIIWGIVLALLGSIIISLGDIRVLLTKLWGDLLALAAAFFAASYLFVGRKLREKIAYFPYLYIVYTYAAIFLGLYTLILGIPFTGYESFNYLCFLGLALGPTLVGHSILNYSVRFLPTTIVSLSILGEPILTTLFAWLILGEEITVVTVLGGLCIILGIYQASRTKIRKTAV